MGNGKATNFEIACFCFQVFLVITYTFEFYMLPVALLILYVKNYVIYALTGRQLATRDDDEVRLFLVPSSLSVGTLCLNVTEIL